MFYPWPLGLTTVSAMETPVSYQGGYLPVSSSLLPHRRGSMPCPSCLFILSPDSQNNAPVPHFLQFLRRAGHTEVGSAPPHGGSGLSGWDGARCHGIPPLSLPLPIPWAPSMQSLSSLGPQNKVSRSRAVLENVGCRVRLPELRAPLRHILAL